MAARETQAQMNPGRTQNQALLAALRCAHPNGMSPREMRISNSRKHVGSYVGPAVRPAPGQLALSGALAVSGGLRTTGQAGEVQAARASARPGSETGRGKSFSPQRAFH
ncbi:hypothetical protein ARTHRO9AX_80057 [Arthrobacter sp. 9AX]|nr:hypothetical protein ARTHRO9AX_80057 [Arthrobacter sp. 9AX]